MNLVTLKAELTADPLGRGYAGMSIEAAAASLNTIDRSRQKSRLSGAEIWEAVVLSEYSARTAEQKSLLNAMIASPSLPIGPATNTRAALLAIFGAGTQTRANLIAAASETVSRATELGLPEVTPGDVQRARAL